MSEDFEELEQIPWAALAAKQVNPRSRLATIAIAVAAVVGVVIWFLMRGNTTPATVSMVDLATPTTIQSVPTAPTEPPASVEMAVPAAAVYSEADLMLIDVADEERLAVAQAEWLVRDYLTVDGDPLVADRIAQLLPGEQERDDVSSYVEWVEAFAVASPEPGRYRVEVLYRVLVGGEAGFTREPAGAVAVEVAVDVDGTTRLLAAPEAVTVPVLRPPGEGLP